MKIAKMEKLHFNNNKNMHYKYHRSESDLQNLSNSRYLLNINHDDGNGKNEYDLRDVFSRTWVTFFKYLII